MDEAKHKPVFDRRIFWDVNFDTLDYDKRARFVFERGDVDDIWQCRRYYGDEKITDVLLTAKFLPERRLHLAAAVIDNQLAIFYATNSGNQTRRFIRIKADNEFERV
jgi:hypothetical protein